MCHPDTSQEMIAGYLALITLEAPTPAADERCSILATECAQSIGQPGTPASLVTTTPASTPTDGAAVAASQSGATGGAAGAQAVGGFTWMKALQFTRGPLFQAAFWFFVIGMLLRLVQALRSGWKHRVAADKTGRAAGAGKSFLTGLLVLPFIPGLKGAFQRKPVMYLAGGLFHLGLLTVILFSRTHMSAWKSQIGFGWPVLPGVAVSWLAAIGIVAMLALLINRLVDPVLRLISGPAEWLNWLMVFLPMLTGFVLARKLWLPYEVSFSIHMLLVDILLIWIPLSRISHFVFYFFSRTIHGVEFNSRRVVTP
jgi:nitrate reductase gamma subunit